MREDHWKGNEWMTALMFFPKMDGMSLFGVS